MFPKALFPNSYFCARYWEKLGLIPPPPAPPLAGAFDDYWIADGNPEDQRKRLLDKARAEIGLLAIVPDVVSRANLNRLRDLPPPQAEPDIETLLVPTYDPDVADRASHTFNLLQETEKLEAQTAQYRQVIDHMIASNRQRRAAYVQRILDEDDDTAALALLLSE